MKRFTKKQIKSDFLYRQLKHNRKVQDYMLFLELNRDKLPFEIREWDLFKRGVEHDMDKFSPEMLSGYLVVSEFYENKKVGFSNDHINEEKMREHYAKHHNSQPHHVKCHSKHKTCPTNLDICEMCCDWTAHCDLKDEANNEKYFKKILVYQENFCKERKEDFLRVLELLRELKKENE